MKLYRSSTKTTPSTTTIQVQLPYYPPSEVPAHLMVICVGDEIEFMDKKYEVIKIDHQLKGSALHSPVSLTQEERKKFLANADNTHDLTIIRNLTIKEKD